MYLSWDDRKNSGQIDSTRTQHKPALSFSFSWLLVTDTTAQLLETFDGEHENRKLNDDERGEVVAFYDSWEAPSPYQHQPTLEERRLVRAEHIKTSAQSLYESIVVDESGRQWRGGQESATAIMGGVQLSEFAGATTITLRDADRNPHVMTMQDARGVAAAIGIDYQIKFQAEEEALRQLELIDLDSPNAADQIAAIDLNAFLAQFGAPN